MKLLRTSFALVLIGCLLLEVQGRPTLPGLGGSAGVGAGANVALQLGAEAANQAIETTKTGAETGVKTGAEIKANVGANLGAVVQKGTGAGETGTNTVPNVMNEDHCSACGN
ncbi:hypothetical protein JYU34_018014 [Plutella xylostella]|uniref:Uncharacterized protein n=1 Tax=Plutella xylostella TaxID=51655 RepID=A0ABQ7Q0X7_PLUXY|nr:uncharacterized protein LOC125490517 [Plutella xylostella]KAG7298395.1 hypothetical protein JYU34_018014 [Plutella xylostella]